MSAKPFKAGKGSVVYTNVEPFKNDFARKIMVLTPSTTPFALVQNHF
jgi:hypothetical protein